MTEDSLKTLREIEEEIESPLIKTLSLGQSSTTGIALSWELRAEARRWMQELERAFAEMDENDSGSSEILDGLEEKYDLDFDDRYVGPAVIWGWIRFFFNLEEEDG